MLLKNGNDGCQKKISLPPELARDAGETARAEAKTLSAVIQEALRHTRAARLKHEFKDTQGLIFNVIGKAANCHHRAALTL